MRGYFLCLTLVSVLVENISANPLLENVVEVAPFARTFAQVGMKPGTRSAFKSIQMSQPKPLASSRYYIRPYSLKVCQLRIDFKNFELEEPSKGTSREPYAHCANEYLRIDNIKIDFCGSMSGQHVYVPFDVQRLVEEIEIDFRLASNSYASWNLEINQIECNHKAAIVTPDEKQAPEGCLQYFYELNKSFESFNYGGYYFGDTRYAICFKRIYKEETYLQLTNVKFDMDGLGNGFDCECLDDPYDDPSDYIAIPFAEVDNGQNVLYHSLFCSDSLDKTDVEFRGPGPIVIHVNTDRKLDENVETGFRFRYSLRRQN